MPWILALLLAAVGFALGRASSGTRAIGKPHEAPVLQLRVALSSADYESLTRFYCGGLGLEASEVWSADGRLGLMIPMGTATLELFDERYAEYVDSLETGRRTSGPLRLALEVTDVDGATERLLASGATLVQSPVVTPWGDTNSRFEDPIGLQVTLFQQPAQARERKDHSDG